MKRIMLYVVAMFVATVSIAETPYNDYGKPVQTASANETNTSAWYRYKGYIGNHKVTFEYQYSIFQGEVYDEELSYYYDNVGKDIHLRRTGKNGKYTIFKEYVNGRHTGTFNIIVTPKSIVGSFVNYKDQIFNVKATVYSHGY